MSQPRRPYVTAGIAIVGASLLVVPAIAPPDTPVQHRAVQLVDYTEVDYSQLIANTDANLSGLESVLSSSNWATDPDISQGLSTLFSDLSAGTSNAVTNPASLLTEGALALLNSNDGVNAALTAVKAVSDNVESAMSSGDDAAAMTDLENGFSTVLNAFLNGYSDAAGSGGLISPEFGLLTNTANGAATGEIDSLAQVSNTVADEVSALGGGDLTTGSLPLLTGNLDLSISISQILSDLGLGSASSLTINGLLSDLGLSPTSDIIPSLNVGDVLGDLGLSSTSGISLGSILSDLGLNSSSGISLGTVLSDLGLTSSSSLSIPSLSIPVDTILTDLGVTNTSGDISLSIPSLSVPVSTILGDLGINSSGSIPITDTVNLGYLGTHTVTLDIPVSTILGDLGINTGGSIGFSVPTLSVPIDTILSDLGITNTGGDITLSVPSISLSSVLSDLGLTDSSTLSLSDVLSALGLNSSSSLDIGDILSGLGLTDSSTIGVSSILSDLGLSSSSSLDIGDILSALGLSSSTAIPLPSVSIDGLLGDLGINPDENLFTLLGIPDTLTLSPDLDLTGGPVATYFGDLGKDLMAALGTIAPVSSNLPSLLGTDPTLNLEPLLSSLLTSLDLPGAITGGDLSADLANIAAELLPSLF